jgi:opine dehydrogenase
MSKQKIAVIGAGNGGQAIAGYLAMVGHSVRLCEIHLAKIQRIVDQGGVQLTGEIEGFGRLDCITDDLAVAMEGSEIVVVVTTAEAHRSLFSDMAAHLTDGQIVLLSPGRTGGALEFRDVLASKECQASVYVAEAQTLVYACRAELPGSVRIIGVKDRVLYSTFPASDLPMVQSSIEALYPCFKPVEHVLWTGMENFGAMFHPTIVLFNAASIERGDSFYFYNDITPKIGAFLQKIDEERVAIGAAYGMELTPAEQWISHAYSGIQGDDLFSKLKHNPAYYKILSPPELRCRLLTEDIPTGLIPMVALGELAGVELPLMRSMIQIGSALLEMDFLSTGRTLERLGLAGKSVDGVLQAVRGAV